MNATLHTLLSNLALHRLYIEKYLQKMQQLHNNEIRTVYFAKNYDVLVPYTVQRGVFCKISLLPAISNPGMLVV